VANCVIVIGALAPTVVTTIFPQFVEKVNVRGIRFNTFSAGATDGGVWPTALLVAHFIVETFADLFFVLAKAEGETSNDEADSAASDTATTINLFT
jgi:hypothetical protein